MILPIRTGGDPMLRKVSQPVGRLTDQVAELVRDMLDTMYNAKGVGLAAPQIGQSVRIVVVDAGDGPLALVNPRVVGARGENLDEEGCLSLPGIRGLVRRAREVTVRAKGADGKQVTVRGEGLLARVLQHEIDHLDGVLFTDRAAETYPVELAVDRDTGGVGAC